MSGDIIILPMYTINENHIFGPEIWSTIDRIFSQFEPFYTPPHPPPTPNNPEKKFEKMKKMPVISSFYTTVP